MNKSECKGYIKKAIRNILQGNKKITLKNLETEMNRVMEEKHLEYIAYAKIAVYTLQSSANNIIPQDIAKEIDSICGLYNRVEIIEKANELSIKEKNGTL